MHPNPTINLLRGLFVVFAAFIGSQVGETFWQKPLVGVAGGMAFGLAVVLADQKFLRSAIDEAIAALAADGTLGDILESFDFPATVAAP